MAEGLYGECRSNVERIQLAYDALLASLDQYISFLQGELRTEEAAPAPDKNKRIALSMQLQGATQMRADMETAVLDDLIRFADRVIRVKHWQDGVFL